MEYLLTLIEVSNIYQFSKSAIYKMVEQGKIPHYKISNRIRFSPKELELWLSE
jgi:excisionase family DNA binding protein